MSETQLGYGDGDFRKPNFRDEFRKQWEEETKFCASKRRNPTGVIICKISEERCDYNSRCFYLQVRRGLELDYCERKNEWIRNDVKTSL